MSHSAKSNDHSAPAGAAGLTVIFVLFLAFAASAGGHYAFIVRGAENLPSAARMTAAHEQAPADAIKKVTPPENRARKHK